MSQEGRSNDCFFVVDKTHNLQQLPPVLVVVQECYEVIGEKKVDAMCLRWSDVGQSLPEVDGVLGKLW